MLGRASRAAPRPAAADDFARHAAIGAEAMPRVPAGEAERGGEKRRFGAARAMPISESDASADLRLLLQALKSRARRHRGRGTGRRCAQPAATASGPSSPIAGTPSLQTSSRAVGSVASSATRSGSARSGSARSRPGAGEKWIRRQARPVRQARLRRRGDKASASRLRRAGRSAATSRRRAARPRRRCVRSSAKWVKTWRTRPSARTVRCGSSVQSGPASAAIPPSIPFGGRRTSQTAAVALDPPCAIPWRCGRARLRLGRREGFRLAARKGGAVAAQRADAASGASGGRWSRRGPSSPARSRRAGRRRACASTASRIRSWLVGGRSIAEEPGDHPLDIGVDRHRASRPKAIAAIAAAV